jgi:RNA polymerase sigma factor (TIGR02999 family)
MICWIGFLAGSALENEHTGNPQRSCCPIIDSSHPVPGATEYTNRMPDVTQILSAIEQGEPHAAEQLLPLVYDELRKLAAGRLAQEKPGQTLQATALVHEAYLRLVGQSEEQHWDSRRHFFAAAAEAMRRILVDKARRKQSHKHGGDMARQDFDAVEIAIPEISEDVLALEEALIKLAATDKTAADLVQLRFFAGLPLAEAAQHLGISPRTVDRLWAYARAWLHQEIQGTAGNVNNS